MIWHYDKESVVSDSIDGCVLKGTVYNLKSNNKYDAIKELVSKVCEKNELKEICNLETAVIEREKKLGTGLGEGVAIAHGKTEYAKKPIVLLGISRKGIDYDAPDGKPVNFLFIITNHPDYQTEYISLLAAIARLVGNKEYRQHLLGFKNVSDIENALARELNCLCV